MQNWTLDNLQYKGLSFYQPKNGYRSSEDSLIIQKCILDKINPDFCGNVFELGTGCGLISLLLALKRKNIKITAIDIQKSLIQIAQKNVQRFDLKNRIEIIHTDMRKIEHKFAANRYDLCFANPPFFCKGSGKLSPNKQRKIARHEIFCSMYDVLTSFEYLLKLNKTAFVIYPLTRLEEFKEKISTTKSLKIKQIRYFKNLEQELDTAPSNRARKFSFCAELKKFRC